MKLLTDLTDLRRQTIAFWSGFKYPGSELDIARVYAFRALDPETASNADVSAAYQGHGWAPQAPCAECGAEALVEIGKAHVCGTCILNAAALITPSAPADKPGLFTRLFKKA